MRVRLFALNSDGKQIYSCDFEGTEYKARKVARETMKSEETVQTVFAVNEQANVHPVHGGNWFVTLFSSWFLFVMTRK
jgi:hypothetical protein